MKSNILPLFNVGVSMRFKTRIHDVATGKVISERPWQKNLVLNRGLNALARDSSAGMTCYPSTLTAYAKVGSGNSANSFASGAVTFTQAATTLTASAGFFTAAMVGALFKWGTGSGGNEIYITGFTSSTVVTVGTSATVAVPEVGTVWMVNKTALDTQLYQTNTYQTASGDCGTTVAGATITFKRTYVIGNQASPYTVNEIGYSPIAGATIAGRAVLSSSDSVGTSNFYVIVIELQLTYSPSAPTAVVNVGTGINTAGTAMNEMFAITRVTTAGAGGTVNAATFSYDALDNRGVPMLQIGSTWTQSASITNGNATAFAGANTLQLSGPTNSGQISWAYSAGSVGVMLMTVSVSVAAAGQTANGIFISGLNEFGSNTLRPMFSLKFTTPVTLPTGTLAGTVVFQITYSRTLSN
jgi:hypothetical protein